jgi:uncharacterized protein (TIGR00369 family)
MAEPATNAGEQTDLIEAVMQRLRPAPFWDHLGCVLTEAAPGSASVRLTVRPEHGRSSNTGDGSAHGGAVASLVDMAASCALNTVLAPDGGRTTIDLALHYLAPARGDLTAHARIRRRGGRTAFIDVDVTDAAGTHVALGRTTFAILPPRRTGIAGTTETQRSTETTER